MKKRYQIILKALTIFLLFSCTKQENNSSELQTKVNKLEAELKEYKKDKALAEMRLTRFDSLDYDLYSEQKWNAFAISHAPNIKVYYPDGHITEGLFPQHIDMLKPMFIFAPDTKIKTHPVKFGTGDWTTVIGEMEGTFSKPMPIGNGKTIPPTGKKFKIKMCTVGHWKGGKMTEEYLFWDNQAFMKQIGLAQ
jgi:hypothetical protein